MPNKFYMSKYRLLFIVFVSICGYCKVFSQKHVNPKTEFIKWNTSEYAFIRHKKPNQKQAICDCEQLNMHLVTIESEKENIFIMNHAFKLEGVKAKDGNQYWIGASDVTKEGNWLWVHDNTHFFNQKKLKSVNSRYNNWGKTKIGQQPNNVFKNEEYENCAVIRPRGFWYDIGCHKRYAYVICERRIK